MERKSTGWIFITFGIVLLVGAVFEMSIADQNKEQYDETAGNGGYLFNSDQEKDDREQIENQRMYAGVCGVGFVACFLMGGLILAFGKSDKPDTPQQTIIYQQAPPQQYPQPPQAPICPRCHGQVQHGWKLCPNCGQHLRVP